MITEDLFEKIITDPDCKIKWEDPVITCPDVPKAFSTRAPKVPIPWPDPTPEMLESEEFAAVWATIKTWDICVPEVDGDGMYSGATGNHVRAILDALKNYPYTKNKEEHE